MAIQEFVFGVGSCILQPALPYPTARLDPIKLGPSLNLKNGTAMARQTSSGNWYPLNTGASDGTQNCGGFLQYNCSSDANSVVYLQTGTGAGTSGSYFAPGTGYISIYTSGIFNPNDLQTNSSPVAEVDTFTPGGTIAIGDVDTVTFVTGAAVSQAVSYTTTATTVASVVAGMVGAWNGNANASAYGVAVGAGTGGTSTFTITSTIPGNSMNLTSSVVGTGTLTKSVTATATGRAIADILPGIPGARILQASGFWLVP